MAKLIWRDYERMESDDFKLNVAPSLDKFTWATELREGEGRLLGWELKPAYE